MLYAQSTVNGHIRAKGIATDTTSQIFASDRSYVAVSKAKFAENLHFVLSSPD